MYQKTIKQSVSINGICLHSGELSTVKISPGHPNTGIVFFLMGKSPVIITSSSRDIISTILSTNLGNDIASVSTIEHFMAAAHALGITNLEVSVSGPEFPILDGSAFMFYRLLQAGWVTEQNAPKTYLVLDKNFYVHLGDTDYIYVEPYDGLLIDMTIRFDHPSIGTQSLIYDVFEDDFESICSARTFGIKSQIEQAQKMGLIKGGSIDNAIVLDETSVINGPLRYSDEFVRHKMLDMVGDIYLNGPIKGFIKCCCSGHKLNNELMRTISSAYRGE